MNGFARSDGRIGIRNQLVVVYLVECAKHVAESIASAFGDDVQVIGFGGCYPNEYADRMLRSLCTHPNVGAALIVSLGCEGFDREALEEYVTSSNRSATTLVIQKRGGTRATIDDGRKWVDSTLAELSEVETVEFDFEDLVVGTICGGSDSTSGITANPAVGLAIDRLVASGATAIFEETGELIGCESAMAQRAVSEDLAGEIVDAVSKAEDYYRTMGYGSFAPGNSEGGLTTIEEKSLGAYSKSGSEPIVGLIKPADLPHRRGLFLMDVVPDGEVRWGFPNVNDNAEIAELMASGAHVILFTTGRGSVVGSAISPVIKVCANPETYQNMSEDMDINAGQILEGAASLADVADEIVSLVEQVCSGEQTASEGLGHQEFVLTYKSFEPAGPACHPG